MDRNEYSLADTLKLPLFLEARLITRGTPRFFGARFSSFHDCAFARKSSTEDSPLSRRGMWIIVVSLAKSARRTMRGGARTVRRAGSRRARTGSGRSLAGVRYPGPSALRGARSDPASEQVWGLDAAGCRARLRGRGLERTEKRLVARGREGRRFPRRRAAPEWRSVVLTRDNLRTSRSSTAARGHAPEAGRDRHDTRRLRHERWARRGRDGSRWRWSSARSRVCCGTSSSPTT